MSAVLLVSGTSGCAMFSFGPPIANIGSDTVMPFFADCTKSAPPSQLGTCVELRLTQYEPRWTQLEAAPKMAAFFSQLNLAGAKLEGGTWSRARYEAELSTWANRQQIEDAERARSRQAQQAPISPIYFPPPSPTVTCTTIGPGMVQCR